jgi:hypothetical protein
VNEEGITKEKDYGLNFKPYTLPKDDGPNNNYIKFLYSINSYNQTKYNKHLCE